MRLFDDVQARTRDLTELLQQQIATANVLKVISRSAFDLQPVFQTVAESAARLCEAERAFIFRFDGELLRSVVAYNASPELTEFIEKNPTRPGRYSASGRAALELRTIHILDVRADPEYGYGSRDVEPIRTTLAVPILKRDELLGVMVIYRLEVEPFTDKQIALVETFADQAAIAIETVRLLDELKVRTSELARSVEELRALGEVSQAVSSTLDLKTFKDGSHSGMVQQITLAALPFFQRSRNSPSRDEPLNIFMHERGSVMFPRQTRGEDRLSYYTAEAVSDFRDIFSLVGRALRQDHAAAL